MNTSKLDDDGTKRVEESMTEKKSPEYIVMPPSSMRYIQGELVQDEEISIIDLWKVLVRRRLLFFSVMLSIILAAGIWILISKPVYESRAVLVIGQVAPTGQLEQTQTLIQRLKEEYKVDDTSEGKRELPLVKVVGVVNKADPNTIQITARGYSALQSQTFLKGVVDKIMREHTNLFQMGLSEQRQLLESLQSRHQQIQNDLTKTEERLSQVHVDPSVSGLLTIEQGQLSSQLVDIDEKESQLRLSMSNLQSKATELIRQPTLTVKPVKPKPILYMLIATILGLFAGIVVVYIAEFLSKERAEAST